MIGRLLHVLGSPGVLAEHSRQQHHCFLVHFPRQRRTRERYLKQIELSIFQFRRLRHEHLLESRMPVERHPEVSSDRVTPSRTQWHWVGPASPRKCANRTSTAESRAPGIYAHHLADNGT